MKSFYRKGIIGIAVGSVGILTGALFFFPAKETIIPPYYHQDAFSLLPGIPTIAPAVEQRAVKMPILLYHYVEYVKDPKDTIRQGLNISPGIFEAQVRTLAEASYSGLFIDDFADMLDGKRSVPEKPVIFTFDDGYQDFYTDVFPILKKYRMKATVYVVPGFLDKPNYMSGEQVREISRSGLVEIAAHTVHHVNLKSVSAAVAQREIQDSKSQLEELIGKQVRNFAYPYGAFTKETAKMVVQSGYRTAASVVNGAYQTRDNAYYLFRLRPGARMGKTLISWLEHLEK